VAQERLLRAATVSRSKGPIVRGIQVDQAEALNSALHFQRVALDYVGNPVPGLLSAVGIKLDAIAKHFCTAGDRLERHSIADAGIDR
jgi:hypothetical protein